MNRISLQRLIGMAVISWCVGTVIATVVWASLAGEQLCMYGPFGCGLKERYTEAFFYCFFMWPGLSFQSPIRHSALFYAGLCAIVGVLCYLFIMLALLRREAKTH